MFDDQQLRRFATDGYLRVPSALTPQQLAGIDREIDSEVATAPPPPDCVGKHFYFLAPERLSAAQQAFHESVQPLAKSLLSPGPLHHAYGHIQLALNLPHWQHVPGGPHLDGYHDPARPHPFTLLVGVFLGDETAPENGNLWVWPGSHLRHAELFRRRGAHALMPAGGHPTMLDDPPDLGDPVPVLAKRGDIVLAHYLLGHNSGGNTTNHTRRALYYRLGTRRGEADWAMTMTDVDADFGPVRRVR